MSIYSLRLGYILHVQIMYFMIRCVAQSAPGYLKCQLSMVMTLVSIDSTCGTELRPFGLFLLEQEAPRGLDCWVFFFIHRAVLPLFASVFRVRVLVLWQQLKVLLFELLGLPVHHRATRSKVFEKLVPVSAVSRMTIGKHRALSVRVWGRERSFARCLLWFG